MSPDYPVYEDAQGEWYSQVFLLRFDDHVFDIQPGVTSAGPQDTRPGFSDVTNTLSGLAQSYSGLTLVKRVPSAAWGDTLHTNIRTGQTVAISDYSQDFEVHLGEPAPIGSVTASLSSLASVEYASGPTFYSFTVDPDDPEYTSGEQYALDKIEAARAWDITRGENLGNRMGLALPDRFFCDYTGTNLHPDLVGKLTTYSCSTVNSQRNHGILVSGTAGAATDNGQGIASLGWNVDLHGFRTFDSGLADILDAVINPLHPAYGEIDVVQNSWVGGSGSRGVVRDLLTLGVVVVGSAGNGNGCFIINGDWECTTPQYPAAFAFDDINAGDGTTYAAQVIAVSASDAADEFHVRASGQPYTYSPGTDPVNDPEQAFVDIAAPSIAVETLNSTGSGASVTHSVVECSGTSCGGPIAAAAAALVLSVNPKLRVDDVYEIIVRSADKIDQVEHPDIHPDRTGWNQYTGYGRLNAYNALVYTLENYGGFVGGNGDPIVFADGLDMESGNVFVRSGTTASSAGPIVVGAGTTLVIEDGATLTMEAGANITVEAGATLTVEPGATLRFAEGRRLAVYGTLDADGASFEALDPADGWNGITFYADATGSLDASTVQHVRQSGFSLQAASSVTIFDAAVTLSDTDIFGEPGGFAHGLTAVGPDAKVTISGGEIKGHDERGVYAAGGAAVGLSDGVEVLENDEGGVLAAGYGSTVGLDEVTIQGSDAGPGMAAQNDGQVNVLTTDRSFITGNEGGLYATSGGGINAGTCGKFGCTQPVHHIFGNNGGAEVDIRSTGGSTVYAQDNWWNTTDPNAVERDEDAASFIAYLPISTTPSVAGGGAASARTGASSGSAASKRGGEDSLSPTAQLVDAAQQSWFDGDQPLALSTIQAAFETALTDDDRRLAYETGVRVLADTDAGYAAPVLAWLGEQDSGDRRPWVLRALAVGYDRAQSLNDARTHAAALADEYADGAHGRWGLAAGVRLAVASGDLAGAAGIAATLDRDWPESDEALEAALLLSLAGVEAGDGFAGTGRGGASKTGANVSAERTLALGPVAPNPSRSGARAALMLDAPAHVRAAVYDVLGRQVAVVADQAFESGEHALALDAPLAPGTYVVRAEVSGDGQARALVRTFTVVR